MYPGIELRLYRYVAALAEELNFTHAALRLHVSQPTLSSQIRDLEVELGVRLFERTKGGLHISLTAAGELFAAEARLTLCHADRAVEGARAANGQHRGPWSLGYSPLIDLRILTKVRQHLSGAHPTAEVHLVSAHTSEQADALMRGKLQAGLVILPMRENGLAFERLYREAIVLALPERHPLTGKGEIEITDLHELPLVTIRGDIEPRFGDDLSRFFRMARIRPRVFQEATTEGEALALVAEVGVAALALSSAQYRPRDRIVFRRFVDELLTAEMALAHLGQNGSPILTSLRTFLLETFQPLTAGRFREGRVRQMNLF
jgi:DNA-binding transcriptional LysR family regulator